MYLDCAAGIAVGALGHAHPELRKVLAERAGKLRHVSKPPVGCAMREPWSDRARDILDACVKHGLPALATGPDALRPAPPLTIAEEGSARGLALPEAAAETLG